MIMYYRRNLNCTAVSPSEFSSFEETQMLSIDIASKHKILICSVYRSPNSEDNNDQALNQLLRETSSSSSYRHVILIGDMNYRNIDWKNGTNTSSSMDKHFHFVETTKDCFLVQHVDQPTRGRGDNKPSLLDLVLTDSICPAPTIEYQAPLGPSDHSLINLSFDLQPSSTMEYKVRYNYKKGDYDSLREQLSMDWSREIGSSVDIEEAWGCLKDKINMATELCIPKTKLNGRKKYHQAPLDRKLRSRIKRKHRAWKCYVSAPTENNYRKYTKERNQIRSLTRKKTKAHQRSIAEEAKTNPKRFWAETNRLTKRKEPVPQLSKSGDPKDMNFAEEDQDKAELLADFFRSVYTQEDDGNLTLGEDYPNFSEEVEITQDSVQTLLGRLDASKSPGPDGINPRILLEAKNQLALPLSMIFRRSLNEGRIPADWKAANVSPIFKKGDKRVAGNYRPVSLTSICCKLMEKAIREGILMHLKRHAILSNRQFGFLPGRSTVLQLLTCLDRWTEALDRGEEVDIIYTDFKKAFDTVPHRRLLQVLEHYGIKDNIKQWIEDFLTNRKQRVVVRNASSDWHPVTSGVPQGSVLGPILFVIYINSLPSWTKDCEIFLYADDAKLFLPITSAEDHHKLQRDLERIQSWTESHLLQLHPGKCKIMTLTLPRRRKDLTPRAYTLCGQSLAVSQAEKDLGVTIDPTLSFDQHLWEKIKKANRIVGLIRHSFLHLDERTFVLLYKALVRPQLEYCNQVWSPHLQKHINAIENVQRRATRMLPGMKELSYRERLVKLKLPTLAFRRLRGDAIETYKIVHGKYDPEVARNFFQFSQRESRRNHPIISKTTINRDIRKYAFKHRAANIWNNLPDWVTNTASVKSFEHNLDKFWIDHPLRLDHHASAHH